MQCLYLILMIVVMQETLELNPDVLKYDEWIKDAETTAKKIKANEQRQAEYAMNKDVYIHSKRETVTSSPATFDHQKEYNKVVEEIKDIAGPKIREKTLIAKIVEARQRAQEERTEADNQRERAVNAEHHLTQLRSIEVSRYACMKFEMYEKLWNTGGPVGADFIHDYIPDNLPDNSEADYRSHHKIWKTILDSSTHGGAVRLRNYFMNKYGVMKNGRKELNTEILSRNIAFAIVMVQNSKHGSAAKEMGLHLFRDAHEVRVALHDTHCIEDPEVLDIVEMFEEVTRGKEKIIS